VTDELKPGHGEAQTKKRIRKQVIYLGFAGVIGGIIGFSTSFFDEGNGNLFQGDWDQLSLDPTLAIVLSALLVFGFLLLPLWGFRMIDELKREYNYIAFTAGSLAVLTAFPLWAMLYAGGFAPPPHAFGIWAVGFFSMMVGYFYARYLN